MYLRLSQDNNKRFLVLTQCLGFLLKLFQSDHPFVIRRLLGLGLYHRVCHIIWNIGSLPDTQFQLNNFDCWLFADNRASDHRPEASNE